jgi:DNA-binding NtrC family response regulator
MMAKILVVDDETGMRHSLAIMLRREGFQVTEVGSVADAVGKLKGETYNLVISDLKMEPLNGIDLLALARRHSPRCPVMIVTAYGSSEARAEAFHGGAVDFLEKPLRAGELQARIERLLGPHAR